MQPGASEAEFTEANNLLGNSRFDGTGYLPWSTSFTDPGKGSATVKDGAFCLTVDDAGVNRWDAQIRHRDMVIERGHEYVVQFRAWASTPFKVRPKVGMSGPPYAEYWQETIELGTAPQTFNASFRMKEADDPGAELAFHVAGPGAPPTPYDVCIDDIYLLDSDFEKHRASASSPKPDIRVNQLGYLPGRKKIATLVSGASEPIEWEIVDGTEKVRASGKSVPHGLDSASGDEVHVIDFSSFDEPGRGYRLRVGTGMSHPFDIDRTLYAPLWRDALAYFYHNRSGVPIEMPYAGEKQYTRPAGHVSDKSVPCDGDADCDYSLDVSKGWYDAGDHGKYVVNGGISVWTLMNLYERQLRAGDASRVADGSLNIPEKNNGVPDLLDEARFELEFLLGMQVPAGKPFAGMAHHKVHDVKWTALPLRPDQAKEKRTLRKVSTAATLNLAATAAQAARLWKRFDKAFADRCQRAAITAFAAAQKNPAIYAPKGGVGGGPYDDQDVTDEFYWAATELFITTGEARYHDAMVKSPYHRTLDSELRKSSAEAGVGSSMTWQVVDALGTISLAVTDSTALKAERAAAQKAIVAAADAYLETLDHQGYRVPLAPLHGNELPWGSNSFVLNNLIVLALAHDFTREPKYLDGVSTGMGYLLGRNPLDQCYITGYGARPLQNPHHRFWAHQIDKTFPPPPPGAVSGGPNSSLQDPHAQAAGLKGCAPQKCFVDHIEAWSVNEITINWNAPLAWVAMFLDQKASSKN